MGGKIAEIHRPRFFAQAVGRAETPEGKTQRGGGLMLHPVVDPETNKKMICAYLHDDLTVSYAIKPLDGGPAGVWYHINQEKIMLYATMRSA